MSKPQSQSMLATAPASAMRIIPGDCISVMCTLHRQGKKFPLIVTDPPYNQGIDYGKGPSADARPYWNYRSWCAEWIDIAAMDLLSEFGSMWIVTPWRHAAMFTTLGQRAGLILRNVIIWHETFGQYATTNFGQCHRQLLYFTRNSQFYTFNADAVRVKSTRQKLGDKRANPVGKIMSNVWEIPRLVGTAKERIRTVPTQLPQALIDPIIAACSNPGDIVLDPFCGSGTVGAAALATARSFIGIECNSKYVATAEERLFNTRAPH